MKSRVAVAVAVAVARGINPKRRFTTLHSWALSSLEYATKTIRDAHPLNPKPIDAHPRVRIPRARSPDPIARANLASRRSIDLMGSNIARTRGNRPRGDLYHLYRASPARARVRRRATGRDARHADRIARAPDGRPTTRERGRRATRETAIERGRAKDARGDDDDADVAGDAGNRCG